MKTMCKAQAPLYLEHWSDASASSKHPKSSNLVRLILESTLEAQIETPSSVGNDIKTVSVKVMVSVVIQQLLLGSKQLICRHNHGM